MWHVIRPIGRDEARVWDVLSFWVFGFLVLIIAMWASDFVEQVCWIGPCVGIWRGGWIGSVVMGKG